MTSTFISYSQPDAQFVRTLRKHLDEKAISAFPEQIDLQSETAWNEAAKSALSACDVVLIVLSPASIESKPVLETATVAQKESKRIIGIQIESCTIPPALSEMDIVDAAADPDIGIDRVLSMLVPTQSGDAAPSDSPAPTSPKNRKFLMWLIAGVLVPLLGTFVAIVLHYNPTTTTPAPPTPPEPEKCNSSSPDPVSTLVIAASKLPFHLSDLGQLTIQNVIGLDAKGQKIKQLADMDARIQQLQISNSSNGDVALQILTQQDDTTLTLQLTPKAGKLTTRYVDRDGAETELLGFVEIRFKPNNQDIELLSDKTPFNRVTSQVKLESGDIPVICWETASALKGLTLKNGKLKIERYDP